MNFKRLDALDVKMVNWDDPEILNHCVLIPIPNKERRKENILSLICKSNLQQKIINHQFDKLLDIYRNISRKIWNFHKTNEEFNQKEMRLINDINYSNKKVIQKYSNLNLLSKLQKYRNTRNVVTMDEMFAEAMYVRDLIIISELQGVIRCRQMTQLTVLIENALCAMLDAKKSDPTTRDTDDTQIIEKNIQGVRRNRDIIPVLKFDISATTPAYFHKSSKTLSNQPKIISPDDCHVCFQKIEIKMAMVPCGHTIVCQKCVANIDKCPTCASQINLFVKLFIE